MSQNSNMDSQEQTPFATLRRFIRPRANVEQCELCSVAVGAAHQHLIEPASRKLVCACDACALLFSNQEGSKYRRVPRRIRFLQNFRLTDAQWESLLIPINMAFFFYSTPAGKIIALYPSPAGPTESSLGFESWEEIARENPLLQEMEPDVEALLINRVRRGREAQANAEYYLVPVDECYKLTGLIRAHWRGLSGGTEVWEEVGRFFTSLQERAVHISEASRA
jgi:hypothetical protein